MYDNILVPTDGSEAADAAVDAAVTLARRFDATLHAIHVLELDEIPADVDAETRDELREHAESMLAAVAGLADEDGVRTETAVVESASPVHRAIVDAVEDRDVDLVVMGTHGRTGLHRLALGSVAERTLRHSSVPVLTVQAGAVLDADPDAVLVPTDGSEPANEAADHGIAFAGRTGAALHVLHVVDVTGLWGDIDVGGVFEALEATGQRAVDAVVDRTGGADLRSVEASVSSGTPARGIVDYADDRGIDLIVMGTHGRTGLDRFLLGSVTENVVRAAAVPVLTVPTPAGE